MIYMKRKLEIREIIKYISESLNRKAREEGEKNSPFLSHLAMLKYQILLVLKLLLNEHTM